MHNRFVLSMSLWASLALACGGVDSTTTEAARPLAGSPIGADIGIGVLSPVDLSPSNSPTTCGDVACDEACSEVGQSVGTPSYGVCESGGCTCTPFILPPSGGGGGGGSGGGCLRTGCPHDQSCNLSGECVPNPFTCDNPDYVIGHLCECVPELNCT